MNGKADISATQTHNNIGAERTITLTQNGKEIDTGDDIDAKVNCNEQYEVTARSTAKDLTLDKKTYTGLVEGETAPPAKYILTLGFTTYDYLFGEAINVAAQPTPEMVEILWAVDSVTDLFTQDLPPGEYQRYSYNSCHSFSPEELDIHTINTRYQDLSDAQKLTFFDNAYSYDLREKTLEEKEAYLNDGDGDGSTCGDNEIAGDHKLITEYTLSISKR